MTRSELCQEWSERIASYEASGQSVTAWCHAHNLKDHQMRYWLQKLKNESQPIVATAKWLSVDIQNAPSDSNDLPLRIKVGPTTIELYPAIVGCFAHARRKFTDTLKALPKSPRENISVVTQEGLTFCNQLLAILSAS